jgi:acyl-CoA reductase-like NAD-dependent aldehyde dehydrogenase
MSITIPIAPAHSPGSARDTESGEEVASVVPTPSDQVPAIIDRARAAQRVWGATSIKERQAIIRQWYMAIAKQAEPWARLVSREIGKPYAEALAGDIVSSLDCIRWTVNNMPRALASERIGPSWQRALFLPAARVHWAPYGVIGMIGTWNYPMYLNAPPMAQALAAGNAVVWKPSELAPLCGAALGDSLRAAPFPEGLITTLQGGTDVGRALVNSPIDKAMFTGGAETGRRVIAELAARGIPSLAELSGFDAAIVLPDSPIDSTAKALAWASFVGCGQTCIAVKRIFTVGDPLPLANAIATIARSLVVGDPSSPTTDIGPMINTTARDRFHRMIQNSVAAGFGPVVVIRAASDAEEAVSLANKSSYALAASVWSADMAVARALARQLHAGMVSINDAVTPASHAAAPFGGAKASGFGRTKGLHGLREFLQPQTQIDRKPGGFRPQLFPYASGSFTIRFLKVYLRIFHGTP